MPAADTDGENPTHMVPVLVDFAVIVQPTTLTTGLDSSCTGTPDVTTVCVPCPADKHVTAAMISRQINLLMLFSINVFLTVAEMLFASLYFVLFFLLSELRTIYMQQPPPPLNAETRAAVRKWVLANRGVLRQVSQSVCPPVSQQFVHQIAYSQWAVKSDHPVRRELLARGWPGGV